MGKTWKDIYKECRYAARDKHFNQLQRNRLQTQSFSIIASDCIGGAVYHDLKHQMDSPTINMYFSAGDFVKFCRSMDFYLKQKMELIEWGGIQSQALEI